MVIDPLELGGFADAFFPEQMEALHIPGLAFFAMEAQLGKILEHRVELHTPSFLSPYFRDQVIDEAEVQYVAS